MKKELRLVTQLFKPVLPLGKNGTVHILLRAELLPKKNEQVIGWAALTPVSSRCVYAGVAEVSVYVNPDQSGKGIGLALLAELIRMSEVEGIWTLQAGIFPENIGSLRIHEKAGFRVLGIREKIGKQHGVWRDTVLLERRSKVII